MNTNRENQNSKHSSRRRTQLQDLEDRLRRSAKRRKKSAANSPGDIVQETASQLNSQLEQSYLHMRNYARSFAARIIKQKAPEMKEQHVRQLIDEWIPQETRTQGNAASQLPSDVLFTMVEQFIAYSTKQMSACELAGLKKHIPDWTEKYWNCFPVSVRGLIADYIKGKMNASLFWRGVNTELSRSCR